MNKRIEIKGHLSRQQIKSYANGFLPREENHAVEDHLLHCDLCSDAVEGYQQFPNADVPAHDRFDNKNQNSKWQIKRIAAVVALLLSFGLGYWVMNEFSLNNESVINLSREEAAPQQDMAIQEEQNNELILPDTQALQTDTGNGIALNQDQGIIAKGNSIVSNEVKPTTKESAKKVESQDLEIEIVDNEALAPAQHDTSSPSSGIKVTKIQDEFFNSKPQEALANEGFIAAGSTNESLRQEGSEEKKIVVQNAAKSKKYIAGNEELIMVSKQTNATIMPIDGWEAFNHYVEDNIGTCSDSIVTQHSGSVVLQIVMEAPDKEPEILVVKGINERCNEMAINLIKEGPKWVIVDNNTQLGLQTAIVTVNFKLD